ncbi:hypothetical protein ACFLU1_07240 [Chloroflexota bacterium]
MSYLGRSAVNPSALSSLLTTPVFLARPSVKASPVSPGFAYQIP